MLRDKNRFKKLYPYNKAEVQKQLILLSINSFFYGKPEANQDILYYVFNRMIEIPKDFEKSFLRCNFAPTFDAIFNIYIIKDGTTQQIAYATVLAGQKDAKFTTLIGIAQVIREGEVLLIRAPFDADSTLADISLNLLGDLLT